MQIAAIVILIAATAFFWKDFRGMTVDTLLNATPRTMLVAAIVILVYYTLKSFIVVIPVMVVQIAAGLLFPTPIAILINLIGLVITLSISYVLGRFTGYAYMEKLLRRYPKAEIIRSLPQKNSILFCFLIHNLSLFPMNVIGMFVGSIGIPYRKYFVGAFLGSLIRVISITVVGASVTNPTSPVFILSLAVTVIVSAVSFILYRRRAKAMQDSDATPRGDE